MMMFNEKTKQLEYPRVTDGFPQGTMEWELMQMLNHISKQLTLIQATTSASSSRPFAGPHRSLENEGSTQML